MISVAFDVRRLVDAHVQRKPFQGITRYTLRLYQELKAREDEVALYPVYLHPLDPVRIGVDRAIQQASGLDALRGAFGEKVLLPWSNRHVSSTMLRMLNVLEYRFHHSHRLVRIIREVQRRLILFSYPARQDSELLTDIFHSPVNPLPPVRRTPSRHRVLTIHDCIYLERPDLYPIPGRTPAIRHAIDSLDLERDTVICDSQHTLRDLQKLIDIPPQRTRVVPLAADQLFFEPDLKAGHARLSLLGLTPRSYVLALAQSEVRKNIPRLIEAYLRSQVCQQQRLLLVCSVDYAPRLKALIEKRGHLSPSIVFATGVDDRTLAGLLALATAFVYVPLYEGFGIPLLEAMASGCPVVAADNSSLPEVVGTSGVYVDAEDTASITAGLARIVQDDDLRERLISCGAERARSFSWQRTANETLELYREIALEPSAEGEVPRSVATSHT